MRSPSCVRGRTGALPWLQASLRADRAVATVTVRRNDGAGGLFALSPLHAVVAESAGSVSLQLVRTVGLEGEVSVRWEAVAGGGTALPDVDFVAGEREVRFRAGQTNATLVVPISDDLLPEAAETFSVVLTGVSAGAAARLDSNASRAEVSAQTGVCARADGAGGVARCLGHVVESVVWSLPTAPF